MKHVVACFGAGQRHMILWNEKHQQMETSPFCPAIRFDRAPIDIDNAVQSAYNAAGDCTGFKFLIDKRPAWWN